MCGRYSLIAAIGDLEGLFDFVFGDTDYTPSYNIAPTQRVLTVVGAAPRRGGFMRWGLLPRWAQRVTSGRPIINVRAETIAEKPTFRDALRHRRCLVLADGFYEWQRVGPVRRPMRVVLRSGAPFAFAGIWSVWRDPDGTTVPSCAIVTTAANDLLRPVHHRMPVILPQDRAAFWLDRSVEDPAALASVLTPYPADKLAVYEVAPLVSSVANDTPAVIAPVASIHRTLAEGGG